MSVSSIVVLLTVIVAFASIAYVWKQVAGDRGAGGDGMPGSVLDSSETVRRVDLGTHTFAAQQAHAELTELGLTTRLITLEQGAFGIGLGEQYFLVYNAEDEVQVLEVVDRLLEDL